MTESVICGSSKENEVDKIMVTTDADKLFVNIYFETYSQCVEKYGKVCLLMEVGTFYEIYSRPDHSGSNAHEIARDLEMKLTLKNRNKGSLSPHMTGFPVGALDIKVPILLNKGYTVVIMDQSLKDEHRPTALRSRQITRVISKATDLDSSRPRNNVVAIFIEKYVNKTLSIGLCSMDTIVSREIIEHEAHSEEKDRGLALDTAIEFITQMDPVECVVVTRNGDRNAAIVKQLSLPPGCDIHYMDVQACQGARQAATIKSPVDTMDETDNQTVVEIDEIDEIPTDTISYHVSLALDGLYKFLAERFYRLSDLVTIPYHLDRHLDLSSNAIIQLDVALLYKCLDKTLTAMGSRLLRDRLVRPMLSASDIENTYCAIERLDSDAEDTIRRCLVDLPDLDRLHRRMSFGRLTASGMRTLHSAYMQVLPLLTANADPHMVNCVNDMIQDYTSKLDFDDEGLNEGQSKGSRSHNSNSVAFLPGLYPELDEQVKIKARADKVINTFMDTAKDAVPCETYRMRDTMGLQTTHVRAELLRKKVRRASWKIRKIGSQSIVYTSELETALESSRNAEEDIAKLTKTYFDSFVSSFYAQHQTTLEDLSGLLAEFDFLLCGKLLARTRRLSRPKLTDSRCLLIKGLRHLVIEDLNPDVNYVPNDCLLDCGTTDAGRHGMALYGVNACGKSSYLKGVGLAVIMVQAGLFAPADSICYKPFKRIMTRIAGGDSIEKGQSSFIVELDDLKSVLSRADADTLILGDEMCRGTEIDSAEALVETTLRLLNARKTPFVTATHLHGIANRLEKISGVDIFHMEVAFDNEGDPVYDRRLRGGPGEQFYGLEIARAHGFPEQFMQQAMSFRNEKHGSSVTAGRVSRYNGKKILVNCEVPECKYKPVGRNALPLDTHHLNGQCNADAEGFHGTQRKDALHNLITLCKQCHIDVHNDALRIIINQTLKGRKVVATRADI